MYTVGVKISSIDSLMIISPIFIYSKIVALFQSAYLGYMAKQRTDWLMIPCARTRLCTHIKA